MALGRRWYEIKGLVLIWESFRPKGFSSGTGRKIHNVWEEVNSSFRGSLGKHCGDGFKVRDYSQVWMAEGQTLDQGTCAEENENGSFIQYSFFHRNSINIID